MFRITLIGLLAGVLGTGLGGLLAIMVHRPRPSFLSFLLGISSGIMLSVVYFSLLHEAFALAPLAFGIGGLLLGVLMMLALDFTLPHLHFEFEDKRGYLRTGIMLGIGIALHNLPEGLAIGTGFAKEEHLGWTIALVIALQNIPEGIAMATPMNIAEVSRGQTLFSTVLAGLPMGVGALLGALVGGISPGILAISLGLAAGAMLFITCDDLIPESQRLAVGHSGILGIVFGVVIGVVMVKL